jgi:hypothetical protein
MLEGETIGIQQECIHPLQVLIPNQFKMPSGKPWLAVIKSQCQKFGFVREFVSADKFNSYAKANGRQSRGVWSRWFVDDAPGVIYEFFTKTSWRSSERYFFHFVDGEKVKLTREEVCRTLQRQ